MKEQLPSPKFNAHLYERPNQNWICGKACEGQACRVGPDAYGHCRATFECQPALEIKEGETKGRYKCMRPDEFGGKCEQGPLPDGTCCRAIAKCVPVRSLRARRRIFTISCSAFAAGILLVGLCGPFRMSVINPGPLSLQHSTTAFANMAGSPTDAGCVACHSAAGAGATGWLETAFTAHPGPFQVRTIAALGPGHPTGIDEHCARCHTGHSFHEPNVVSDHSCSACHVEHQGPGRMPQPTDANCLFCHANAEIMQASAAKGKTLPASAFDFRPSLGRVVFNAPRPPDGYTRVIHSFATDHPEFQIIAQRLRDPDTLKFNHNLHLTAPTIQPMLGRRLECNDCHKPDASGALHLRITYEESCRPCHSLQFDARNPELRLPHGNADHVRDFLHSLRTQYADFARQNKGLVRQQDVDDFVERQMRGIRDDFGSAGELERRVFFSDARSGPVSRVAGLGGTAAARFPGCAYCHQVNASDDGSPMVTKPVVPDRWLARGTFTHAPHFKVECAKCHDAVHSRDTSDVLLPGRDTCTECHSPKGGVAFNCSECHGYHNVRKEEVAAK